MKLKLSFLFIIITLQSYSQIDIDSLNIERKNWNETEYAFIRNVKPNMLEARKICNCLKMDLVKIETEAENMFLQSEAFSKAGVKTMDGNQYWIGATDLENEGVWKWIPDSSTFYDEKTMTALNNSYENWGKTGLGIQPNNVFKNDEEEDCTVIRADGNWYDIGCFKRFSYIICESIKR